MVAATVVISQQKLVGEDRGKHVGAVVCQPSMPHAMVQLEQRFEPVVERFDRLAASGVEFPSLAAFEELAALAASRSLETSSLRDGSRLPFALGLLRTAGILRAQKTLARAMS